MKCIWLVPLSLSLLVTSVRAQDSSVVERLNRLSVYVEELLADRAQQQKQIADLTREVESLRDQLATTRGGASEDEVARLAEAIREVEQKRQADRELILKEMEKLGKTLTPRPATTTTTTSGPAPVRGFEYTVQEGDTISAIVEAYRKEGYKISVEDVLKANRGLNPNSLRIGQKIVIPER